MERRLEMPRTSEIAVAHRPQRRYFRQKIRTLSYVNLDRDNGGIIRDLNQCGMAVQTVTPLQAGQNVQVRFELRGPRIRVDTAGRIAWSDPTGQAGVEFINPAPPCRELVKEWVLTQVLSTAHRAAWDSRLIHPNAGDDDAANLLFSTPPRPAISIALDRANIGERQSKQGHQAVSLSWCPVPISRQGLAWFVDGLMLLSALLFFSVVSLAMTHDRPAWPVTLIFALGVTMTFAALYWYLFAVWVGATPGQHLAGIANDSQDRKHREKGERFR